MEQDGNLRGEGSHSASNEGVNREEDANIQNNNANPVAAAAEVTSTATATATGTGAGTAEEMLAAPESNVARPAAASAASVPTHINTPLSSASHQSMLRQLAHSPAGAGAGAARAMMPTNRSHPVAAAGSHQEALRHAQPQPHAQQHAPSVNQQQQQQMLLQPQGRQQQQPQQQPALNINIPPANNNNNNNNVAAAALNNNPGNNDNNNNNNLANNPHQLPPERETEAESMLYHPCSPTASASSGWSVVETLQGGAGGAPPSARSLHAAALLNGIMYVFGGRS